MMVPLSELILLFLFFGSCLNQKKEHHHEQIHELVPGQQEDVDCFSSAVNTQIPSIYCYNGGKKELKSVWKSVSISIKLNNDQFELFEGESPEAVMKKFRLHQSSWSKNLFPFRKRKSINLDPFNRTCVGILTSKSYSVRLIVNEIDGTQLFHFIVGLFLFFYARKLCHNLILFYLCGVTIGICFSIIVLIYLISRIFPNKPLMYTFTLGGSTLAFYFIQYLLDNVKLILLQYKEYVLGYVVVSGLISFALCYRIGPMTNPRTKNLVQWSLQFIGLALVYHSSHLYEVTFAIQTVLILSRILPISLFFKGFTCMQRRLFRPRIKLLTKKEYIEQGREETRRALEELRGYCSSPESDPWKTVMKLKSPKRFAEFINGSSHLSDDEVDQYGSLCIQANGTIITDDSDSIAELSEDEIPLGQRLGE